VIELTDLVEEKAETVPAEVDGRRAETTPPGPPSAGAAEEPPPKAEEKKEAVSEEIEPAKP